MKAGSSLGFWLALLVAFAVSVNAHTHLRDLIIGGKTLDRGQCIRPYIDDTTYSYPAKDPNDIFMRCRTPYANSTAKTMCDVQAGSTIKVEWHELIDPTSRGINPSHMGPCVAYMAPLSSNGDGKVWFKIYENGYDPKTKKWCIDTVNDNNGTLPITIPSDLLKGSYLLRTEIIALHLAYVPFDKIKTGAEYYSNCAELNIVGGGNVVPPGVAFPGAYDINGKGIVFNITAPFDSYPIPGPPLYKAGAVIKPCTTRKRRRRELA
ncbi:hypothetical protein GGI04_004656 [Coemansia thaxteri]|uniref:AA9 family lytic polysaccharide monooxygenase n=1 Tax=Coemansia thaxteri TaxID=2663907 RepID=A0A9W8BDL0_9FUNG|nr:hypothetical protein GGI04_004656 [Coemansia thaxteri]KAJ2003692.1 hypothetical protein H4R26_002934 [Coemansia thaxteri]KAJ2470707.1 hypothetical protein GGI02_002753 [Coemansia sp. RSA 2322]KAJ2483462.1 hypothetical protein EV174_002934 [Coemansia sp. RSA 2320]